MYVLWRVIVKEFLQIRRDRRMIPVIFVAPVVQIVVFGFAVNTDVTNVPTVLVDQDRSAASRDLVSRFVRSGYFEIVGTEERADAVDRWLVTSRAQIGPGDRARLRRAARRAVAPPPCRSSPTAATPPRPAWPSATRARSRRDSGRRCRPPAALRRLATRSRAGPGRSSSSRASSTTPT